MAKILIMAINFDWQWHCIGFCFYCTSRAFLGFNRYAVILLSQNKSFLIDYQMANNAKIISG